MKNLLFLLLLLCFCSFPLAAQQRIVSKWQGYRPTKFNILRITPEEYRNKKLAITVSLTEISPIIPDDLETNFRQGRYIYLEVERPQKEARSLPIIARKNDDIVGVLSQLTDFPVTVILYSRVKKLTVSSKKSERSTKGPDYYLDIDGIELVKIKPPEEDEESETKESETKEIEPQETDAGNQPETTVPTEKIEDEPLQKPAPVKQQPEQPEVKQPEPPEEKKEEKDSVDKQSTPLPPKKTLLKWN